MRSSFVISALFCLFAGQAMSIPLAMPMPMARAIEQREPIAIEPINAYVRRQNIPVEDPVKAPNGVIEPYKRDLATRQNIPVEDPVKAPNGDPVKAPNGVIEPYRRDLNARQNIPVEDPVKAPNGVIEPYRKRELATRQNIPVEDAVKAPNGIIERY
ncbi:hypothetical protein P691DRAFT_812487 [Macrolepiota fuliginosa MF-IS2]|uniref:Uncharacterized protein n=1 Tax=Macrolepiota fuliginosa MF-IS2 TaxID=1400762 RepID=A0A9P5XLU2_9AGAR|nr:hypothetical protein P691DRAFT_812487 [Macrolepiota fuliginosa MF-IS2]